MSLPFRSALRFASVFPLLLILASVPARAQNIGDITTVAGTGAALPPGEPVDSYVPGPSARLLKPRGMAVGARGGIFFADGNLLRKYNPVSGLVRTLAGTVEPGYAGDGGTVESARFYNLTDVAADASGNLYVADAGNYRIRKIAFDGTVSTVVGTGTQGTGEDGPALAAQLTEPTGLALDPAGNLYIADGYRVRKLDAATQTLTTVVSSYLTFEAFFLDEDALHAPIGRIRDIAVASDGDLYLSGIDLGQIFRLSGGRVFWVAGAAESLSPGDGKDVSAANFASPGGLALYENGDLMIADLTQHRIRRISAFNDLVTTDAGSGPVGATQGVYDGDEGPATLARLNSPWSVVVHPSGDLYIADTNNLRIRRVDKLSAPSLFNGAPFPVAGLEYGEDSAPPRPDNDDVEAAILLTGISGEVAGTNLGATIQTPFRIPGETEPAHGYAFPEHSVWYRWTPVVRGRATFETADSDFDTRLSVYEVKTSDPVFSWRRVASNDDLSGDDRTSRASFDVDPDAGVEYYVVVDGAMGMLKLRWETASRFSVTSTSPWIEGVEPGVISRPEVSATIRVKGRNFFGSPQISVNGVPRPAQILDASTLETQVTAEEIPLIGTLWLRVEIGMGATSNTYALDVMPFTPLTGLPGGFQTGGTPSTEKTTPGVAVAVQCPMESPCTAIPAVGALAEARNMVPPPGRPVGDSLYIAAAANALRLDAAFLPAVDIPEGTRLIALKSEKNLTMEAGELPLLGGGDLPFLSSAGGTSPTPTRSEVQRSWRSVKGSGGALPGIAPPATPGASGAVTVTFDATSVPTAAELSETVFALVELKDGDIDHNNRLDVHDAVVGLQAAVGMLPLTELQVEVGDVAPAPGAGPRAGQPYGDGVVDVQDVVRILRTAVGLP